ncbi:MAG: acyltransferase family protein [Clostridia bacterium]|nr:acyltransferase family protein [Clostridia bacterium]MBO5413490.1 acyltransferase family protein [Clostridia bacterium]
MKRNISIDVLKGIGIILVVFGHLNPCIYLEKWIYSFHMFLFFFLSGYVFKKKTSLGEQFKTSTKTLLLPYAFWNAVAIIFSLLMGEYTFTQGIEKMFFLNGVSWNAPVWFLVVLFWSRMFYQALSNKKHLLITILCLMVFCSYYGIFDSLPMGLNILPNAIIFFGIGVLLSKIQISKTQYFLAVPMIFVSILGSQLNNRISMYGNYFGNYIIALIAGVSGVVGIFLIAKLVIRNNIIFDLLKKCGAYSMNVMCTHYFLLRFLQYLSVSFLNGYDVWHAEGFLKAVFVTIVVFVSEVLIVKLLKRLNISNSHIMRV